MSAAPVSAAPRAMDDLDRLAFRLVRTIRQRFPQLRERGFTLGDLESQLLPFRDARRELADGAAHAWEITMLRLVGGERGYLVTDAGLQHACRQALMVASPTMALVRGWTSSTLMLGGASHEIGMERVSGAFDAVLRDGSSDIAPSPVTVAAMAVATSGIGTLQCGCRYCGGRLPNGRDATFCPHCGLDLTKRQCPACSTQLEVAWRFCVTCGRSADLPDFPTSAAIPTLRAKAG